MAQERTQFSRKIHVAFGILVVITLAVAWYFFDTVKWFESDLRRISSAREVLQEYEVLSGQVLDRLNTIQTAVFLGTPSDPESLKQDSQKLRATLLRIHDEVVQEASGRQDADAGPELSALDEIGKVVEQIIESTGPINDLLGEGRKPEADAQLAQFHSNNYAGEFKALLTATITQRQNVVDSTHEQAVTLARYITRILPPLMIVLVVVTVIMVYLFSKDLTHSIGKLHDAAEQFSGGNLGHRIPDLKEREFFQLSRAFNTMARELEENRASLHDINVKLEAKIDERTRALQESNQKLAQVDENRRKLLADISHEFRTPLTVIRGESEIALRGASKTKAEYRETLERIMEQADQTTRLVDDLLFIARANAGEPRLEIRSVPIVSIVEAVCNDFSAPAKQKNITILPSCKGRKAAVLGDAGRLRQVFAILLDNALRYSFADSIINVGLRTSDTEVTITVKDRGIGLSDEDHRNAFRRFYRGAQAAGHARGTGLGLPVAKAIVTAHNGSITLEGSPGEGAVATIVLPIEDDLRDLD